MDYELEPKSIEISPATAVFIRYVQHAAQDGSEIREMLKEDNAVVQLALLVLAQALTTRGLFLSGRMCVDWAVSAMMQHDDIELEERAAIAFNEEFGGNLSDES
jgi:hypothetical protein